MKLHSASRIAGKTRWVLLAAAMAAGCAKPPPTVATAPTVVTVAKPIVRTVTDNADFTGRTSAVESVEIRARVYGYLEKVHFREGNLVEKGALLFEIDPRTYKATLAQSEASLTGAKAKAARLGRERDRVVNLAGTGAVSREELDRTLGEKLEADSSVAIATAARDMAKINLDFTRVFAPIRGRVSRTNITPGNLVQSGESAGGTLLTTIVSVDKMHVYFDIDEMTLLRAKAAIDSASTGTGSAADSARIVRMALANEDGFPRSGVLDFVDNELNPRTGTLRVRAVFKNDDGALTPGLFVRVHIPIGDPHRVLLVTDRAIETNQGQKVVYVVDAKNEVVARTVRLGATHDGLRAVEGGLKADERVIVNGLQRVRPGVTVDSKPVEMPTPPRAGGAVIPVRSDVRAAN